MDELNDPFDRTMDALNKELVRLYEIIILNAEIVRSHVLRWPEDKEHRAMVIADVESVLVDAKGMLTDLRENPNPPIEKIEAQSVMADSLQVRYNRLSEFFIE